MLNKLIDYNQLEKFLVFAIRYKIATLDLGYDVNNIRIISLSNAYLSFKAKGKEINKIYIDQKDGDNNNLIKSVVSFKNIKNEILLTKGYITKKHKLLSLEELPSLIQQYNQSNKEMKYRHNFLYKYLNVFNPICKFCKKKSFYIGFSKLMYENHLHFSTNKNINDPFDLTIMKSHLNDNLLYSDNLYVLSMSSSYKNIGLWSNYADGHRGVCFKFKFGNIKQSLNNEKRILFGIYGNVLYKKRRPRFKGIERVLPYCDFSLKSFLNKTIPLFTKNKIFENEKEARFVVATNYFCSNGCDIICSPVKCYVGCAAKVGIENIIKRNLNIKTENMHMSENNYRIESR